MTYEELLTDATNRGIVVKEYPLRSGSGRINKNRIAIDKNIITSREKKCILAEEIAHYDINTGNILNQEVESNCKQEYKARLLAYDRLVGIRGIIEAYEAGCRSIQSMSDYLDVTCDFLHDALKAYESKYGEYTIVDQYIVYFIPYLGVMKLI